MPPGQQAPVAAPVASIVGEARGDDDSATTTVLVVGTDDWAIEQSSASLALAGYQVLRCHEPGEAAFPCNALREGRHCPLDVGANVVVTSRARPMDTPAAEEMGVVCALHAHLPLVVTGISRGAPFTAWAAGVVADRGELADAVTAVVRDEAARAPQVVRLPKDPTP